MRPLASLYKGLLSPEFQRAFSSASAAVKQFEFPSSKAAPVQAPTQQAAGQRLGGPLFSRKMGDVATTKFKVLFCGVEFPSAFEYTRELLRDDADIEVEFFPREQVPDKIEAFHFIIPRMCRLDEATLARAKNAKVICQYGVGLEGVDIPAATKGGIKVARIGGSSNRFNAISCAEHCIYLMLGLLRNQHAMAAAVDGRRLGEPVGDTLWGKTVLIIGFGAIGEELAPRLKAFQVRVLGIRRSWSQRPGSNGIIGQEPMGSANTDAQAALPRQPSSKAVGGSQSEASVDEKGGTEDLLRFVAQADVVVMCAVLTDETRGMVNAEFYATMKKGALLVNIARGGLLDYEATKAALESGHLGGLGIDVAWHEPFDPTDPIVRHPHTIITPHVGGVTHASYTTMAQIMSETIRQVKAGEPLTAVEMAN